MIEMRVIGEIDWANDAHALGLGLDAGELDACAGGVHLDTRQALVEIELPPGSAELAIGRELQPDLLLLFDDRLDLAVLDRFQFSRADLALGVPGARLLQRRGPQQAADVVGAEWRLGFLHRTDPVSA
jgi:hypothetical protein